MKVSLSKAMKEGFIILSVASIFLFSGCLKKEPVLTAQEYLDQNLANVDKTRLAADLAAIDDSLAIWGLTDMIETEPNGVRYMIEEMGTGMMPTLENAVRMKYSGKLLSTGVEFDASEGFNIYVSDLIIGFQTTLPLFPVGTKVTLYIPSGYGYGSIDNFDNSGNLLIPANSNLIFDVELLEIF